MTARNSRHSRNERAGLPHGKKILPWLPTGFYIALIIVMASRPAPKMPGLMHSDKILHGIAYCVLAVLSHHSFRKSRFVHPGMLTILLAAAVGLADETVQYLSRVRSADLYDLLADVIGAGVGVIASTFALKLLGTDEKTE
jgi:VanZ family protein